MCRPWVRVGAACAGHGSGFARTHRHVSVSARVTTGPPCPESTKLGDWDSSKWGRRGLAAAGLAALRRSAARARGTGWAMSAPAGKVCVCVCVFCVQWRACLCTSGMVYKLAA